MRVLEDRAAGWAIFGTPPTWPNLAAKLGHKPDSVPDASAVVCERSLCQLEQPGGQVRPGDMLSSLHGSHAGFGSSTPLPVRPSSSKVERRSLATLQELVPPTPPCRPAIPGAPPATDPKKRSNGEGPSCDSSRICILCRGVVVFGVQLSR